ncbi:hypothetical protein, partial [Xanthomonas arboricola]|uniref:hypothetical protein n=1 Tax=Xanthomonas arboricola TaxID=56448 RepID=UPI0011B089ED
RGNNTLYEVDIPASALQSGSNRIEIGIASGSADCLQRHQLDTVEHHGRAEKAIVRRSSERWSDKQGLHVTTPRTHCRDRGT